MKKAFILLIGAGVVLFSCANPSYQRLEEIEKFIQENPDSAKVAWDAFRSVDSTLLQTDREIALYSLMKVMLKDKNYVDVVDPGEIEPAVGWYVEHNRKDRYAKSLFYSGRIHYNIKDYPAAIVDFHMSKDEADSLILKLLSTSAIGLTYSKNYINDEELHYAFDAMELSKEYGNMRKMQQARLNLATAYHNNENDQAADSLLSLICQCSQEPIPEAYFKRAEYYIKGFKLDYGEICSLFETGIDSGGIMESEHDYQYAYALYMCGKKKQAFDKLDSLSSIPEDVQSCLWRGMIAKEEGDYQHAFEYAIKVRQLTDSTVKATLNQSVLRVQMQRYSLRFEQLAKEKKQEISLFLLFSILLISLMVTVFFYYRAKQENLEKRMYGIAEESSRMLREAQYENEEAKSKSIESENRLKDLRKTYARLYQRQFSEIGHLFDYCRNDTSVSKEAASRYIEKTAVIIREINQGSERQGEFENRINGELDNIMLKLRKDFPELKESDFRFLSYVIVGFDATTRAIILNETPNNMRVKKARLVKKILNSNNENIFLYSCFLQPDK